MNVRGLYLVKNSEPKFNKKLVTGAWAILLLVFTGIAGFILPFILPLALIVGVPFFLLYQAWKKGRRWWLKRKGFRLAA